MRYLGGKARQAPFIVSHILRLRGNRTRYIEPFVGGGSVLALAAPHFQTVEASDLNPDLMLLWKAVQRGWVPPDRLTKAHWMDLKVQSEPSALRAWAGFAHSYRGLWFEGYSGDDPRSRVTARVLTDKVKAAHHARFFCRSYVEAEPSADSVVYCDPPYEGTKGYRGTAGAFDSGAFWNQARVWAARGALVLVSEYAAPFGWFSVGDVIRESRPGPASREHRVEGLFTC